MKEILLIKEGEIALKGLNRSSFESVLIKNIHYRLKDLGPFRIQRAQSAIFIQPLEDVCDLDLAVERLQQIFGIAAFSRAAVVEKDFEQIKQVSCRYLAEDLRTAATFKVDAKRSDKTFLLNTPAITRELGGYLLEQFPHLKVDVHQPQLTVMVEIRDFGAYVYAKKIRGAGGLPVGTGGRAMLLLSGGIDSPVAGYMMAKRGVRLSAVHFVSPPYTSDRARQKVETLCSLMTAYCGAMDFYCVPFTEIQVAIKRHCPEDLFTLMMRRMMMRISQHLSRAQRLHALVTGESLGQVASQTLSALAVTDAVSELPVLRPLIGMDKREIIEIANRIGTFETSILPYEDCCTVFTPKHPQTHPRLDVVERAEQQFDFEPLVEQAVRDTEIQTIPLQLR